MAEIPLDSKTPVIRGGRFEIPRSRQDVLRCIVRLRAGERRKSGVQEDGRQKMGRRRLRAGPHSFGADVINYLSAIIENPEAAAHCQLAVSEHIPGEAGPRAQGDRRSLPVAASIFGDTGEWRTGGGVAGRIESAPQDVGVSRASHRVYGHLLPVHDCRVQRLAGFAGVVQLRIEKAQRLTDGIDRAHPLESHA